MSGDFRFGGLKDTGGYRVGGDGGLTRGNRGGWVLDGKGNEGVGEETSKESKKKSNAILYLPYFKGRNW